MTTEQHTCEVIEQLVEALTDPESQPNQFGVVFGMHGPRMFFAIGNQSFDLAYEPDEPEEFEFMKRMLCSAFYTFTPDVKTVPAPSTAGERAQVVEIDTSQERVDKTAGNGDMVPLSAIRPIAVEAIRAVTGCPDIRGNDKYLVDEIEDIAKHAALLQSTAHHIGDANKMVAALPVGELMVDMTPPATARDRWMFEQGRLAERDPRSHPQAPRRKAQGEQDLRDAQEAPFESWWSSMGQYGRAGGGGYEKTFAWNAWCAAASLQPVREPLTEERIKDVMLTAWRSADPDASTHIVAARAIEEANGITKKGAPGAAREQTP